MLDVSDVRCLGYGAGGADSSGSVHAYMLSAPGCWALHCSLEDWKATLLGQQAATAVQHMVDSYAAQHPTNLDRRNRQSVAVHLMSLCASLDQGVPGERLRSLVGAWTHREYPALAFPPQRFEVMERHVDDAEPANGAVAVLGGVLAADGGVGAGVSHACHELPGGVTGFGTGVAGVTEVV